jgi:hypothetical protein
MDPNANVEEQRAIAQQILDMGNTLEHRETGKPTISKWALADRLAELVLALDEWRRKGGFDPYAPEQSRTYACPECGAEVDLDTAEAL